MTDDEYSMLIKGLRLLINQLDNSAKANYCNELRYDNLCKMRNDAEKLKMKLCTEWRTILSGKEA